MDYGFTPDPGETITKVVHRHIFDVLPSFLLAAILALAAAGLAYVQGLSPQWSPFPPTVGLSLIGVMLLLSMLIFVVSYYVYRHNVLVFTNVHLIQVEKLALFQSRVSQLSFVRIEDVTGQKNGILQSVFNYGNVQVQSAGEQEKFIFRNAPDPQELADEILEIHESCVREGAGQEGVPAAPAQPTA